MTGIIILAHGSKRDETRKTLDSIILKVRKELKSDHVEGAYLQLCEPSLEKVIKRYYNEGIRNIKIMPMFLFDGVHVQTDIPEYIEDLKKQMPDLFVKLVGHIGADDRIAQIVIDRLNEGGTI